jgi:hypothetical protein
MSKGSKTARQSTEAGQGPKGKQQQRPKTMLVRPMGGKTKMVYADELDQRK